MDNTFGLVFLPEKVFPKNIYIIVISTLASSIHSESKINKFIWNVCKYFLILSNINTRFYPWVHWSTHFVTLRLSLRHLNVCMLDISTYLKIRILNLINYTGWIIVKLVCSIFGFAIFAVYLMEYISSNKVSSVDKIF